MRLTSFMKTRMIEKRIRPYIRAELRYAHIAPRKARVIADLIRYMTLNEATAHLTVLPHRGAKFFLKLLFSAASNAKHNFQMSRESLYIARLLVHGGPISKRWMPRARGMASPIYKRMSHIIVELAPIEQAKKIKTSTPLEWEKTQKELWQEESREVLEERDVSQERKPTSREEREKKQKPKLMRFIPRMFRRKSV